MLTSLNSAHTRAGRRRLQLFRVIFQRVIDRDVPFGALLRRVKDEYERELASAQQAANSQRRATASQSEASRELVRQNADFKEAAARKQAQNDQLHSRLQAAEKEQHALREKLQLYESKQHVLHEQPHSQPTEEEIRDDDAVATELARDLPASARPALITPTLGSGRLAVVGPIAPPPLVIPALDMLAVERIRLEDERAQAGAFAADGGQGSESCNGHIDQNNPIGFEKDEISSQIRGSQMEVIKIASGTNVPKLKLERLAGLVPSYYEEFMAAEALGHDVPRRLVRGCD